MKRFLFSLLLIPGLLLPAAATHIVGGELEVQQFRGYRYEVRLVLYFDDINAQAGVEDDRVEVNIFTRDGDVHKKSLVLPQTSDRFISYPNPGCAEPGEVRTRKIVYSTTHLFNPDKYTEPGGYYLSWDRCCRNGGISNIYDPEETGMLFYAEIPRITQGRRSYSNSSPQFNDVDADYGCKDELLRLDYSANDPDGDSLVYSMATPIAGPANLTSIPGPRPSYPYPAPYDRVDWIIPPYSAQQAILGNPHLNIDSSTGMLRVAPQNTGLYVFSVVCEEYRDGEKIGEVRRDFQLKVLNCPDNREPEVNVKPRDSSDFYQEGDTVHISSVDPRHFRVFVRDSSDINTVNILPVNFDREELIFEKQDVTLTGLETDSSITFEFYPCANSTEEPYEFYVITKDQNCPVSQLDSLHVFVDIDSIPNKPPELDLSLDTARLSMILPDADTSFTAIGTDPEGDYVRLYAEGRGFSMDGKGMRFPEKEGDSLVQSGYYWKPECEDLEDEPYEMVFTAEDNSCFEEHWDKDTVVIKLQDREYEQDYQEPNVVTPNGDGKNDCFRVPGIPPDNCEWQFQSVKIYNRWGSRVFKSTDRKFSWCPEDGVTDGDYYYTLEFSKKTSRGWIKVIR